MDPSLPVQEVDYELKINETAPTTKLQLIFNGMNNI